MKKSGTKSKKSEVPQVDPYLDAFMNKIAERFAALERKMDAVIAAASARPSQGGLDSRASQEQALQARERNARRERIMFEAICADCKVPCEVPFRPSEGRAIYCKKCFAERRAASGGDIGRNQPSNFAPAVSSSTPVGSSPAALVRDPASRTKKSSPPRKNKKK